MANQKDFKRAMDSIMAKYKTLDEAGRDEFVALMGASGVTVNRFQKDGVDVIELEFRKDRPSATR